MSTVEAQARVKTSHPTQPTSGADVVVQALVNHGVDTVFAYPGGASIPLHQALTRFRDKIRVVLPRHEQGGGFAAQGYARSTGKVGVCCATSGPGATNLVTTIADAKLDSVPMVAITGQVGTSVIGSDAFQETPIIEVCRSVTKHHYLVTDPNHLARVVREAFHVASTGRPGPVLIDLPKNVQLAQVVPDYDQPMDLPGYTEVKPLATDGEIEAIARLIAESRRPVIYAGGGCVVGRGTGTAGTGQKTGIPVTTTLTGLGGFPGDHPLALDMLGMHGSVYANLAVSEADLLLAFGVRFDDRVTGKVSEFAKHGKIVHVDIDASEINKIRSTDLASVSDVKYALGELNKRVKRPAEIGTWAKRSMPRRRRTFKYDEDAESVLPQHDPRALAADEGSRHDRRHRRPAPCGGSSPLHEAGTWLSSAGLGTMGSVTGRWARWPTPTSSWSISTATARC